MNKSIFGDVSIVGVSDCGEKICAAGGRISTLPGNAKEILSKSEDTQKNSRLIKKVTSSGHTSVTEHIYFNLCFCDVSVLVEQFMIEFRLAAYTVKSRRYVDFSNAGYCVPEFQDDGLREKYISHIDSLFEDYGKLLELGIKKEDARFLLPYCFRSNFFCSLDGRELMLVIRSMLYGRGRFYPELVELGRSLEEQAKKIAPGIYEQAFEDSTPINDITDLSGICEISAVADKKAEICELISYTTDVDRAVAFSAVTNYSGLPSGEIDKLLSDSSVLKDTIERVMNCSRPRELEHISFTFRLNDLSLASITHLVRHRIHSLNIPPLYNVDKRKYIIPPEVKKNGEALKIYTEAFKRNIEFTASLKQADVDKYTLSYLDLAGNTLDVVSTMNGRQLVHFLCLRTCNRAQWEIREYACDMLKKLRKVSPCVFSHCGPTCFTYGRCPEGRLSCGKMKEVKDKFGQSEI